MELRTGDKVVLYIGRRKREQVCLVVSSSSVGVNLQSTNLSKAEMLFQIIKLSGPVAPDQNGEHVSGKA